MKKTSFIKITKSLILTFLLTTGCDKEKIPLVGKRESLFLVDQKTFIGKAQKKTHIQLNKPSLNDSFPQVGGCSTNLSPHTALGSNLKPLHSIKVGSGDFLASQIVGFEGTVYGIDSDGSVFAAKGENIVWKFETNPYSSGFCAGVAVTNDHVFAANATCEVFCLKRSDGSLVWKLKLESPIRSAPAITIDKIYVQTIDNKTIVIDQSSGKKLWSHVGISETVSFIGGAKPAITDHGDVLSAYSSGEVFLLNGGNGFPLWSDAISSQLRSESIGSIPHIKARPVIFDSKALVVSHSGKLVIYNLKTGDREFEQKISAIRTPVIQNDFAFIFDSENKLICLNIKTGEIYWHCNLEKKEVFSGPIIAGDFLILTSSNSKILFIDPKNGEVKKTLYYDGKSYNSPIVMQETLYLLTEDYVLHSWK